MTTYNTQRIRILQDVTRWYESGTDTLTAASPRFGNGGAVDFEFAFAFGTLASDDNLIDLSNYSSLTLDIKRETSRTGLALMTKTLSTGDLNTTLTKAEWEGGAEQHATFSFTQAESDIFIVGTSETLWMVVSGMTSGGKLVPLAAYGIVVVEDGAGVTTPAPVVAPTYYTAAQSDARYLLATDITAKLNNDGSNAMTGDLTLANSTPSNALHAASRGYVLATAALYAPLAGATFTGMVTLPATAPSTGNHATNKTYVDAQVASVGSGFVPATGTSTIAGLKTFSSLLTASAGISVAGGVTLTSGALTLFAAPSSGFHAATKTYVDSSSSAVAAASVPNTGTTTIAGLKTFSSLATFSAGITVSASGLSVVGGLTVTGGMTLTVASVLVEGVLKGTAGVVTGSATTTDMPEGSRLYYTDARVRAATLTGLSTATGTAITSTDTILIAFGRTENRLAALESTRLLKSGDTMTGELSFSGTGHAGVRVNNLTNTEIIAIGAVSDGYICYDTTLEQFKFREASTWKTLTAGTGTGWLVGGADPTAGEGSDGNFYLQTDSAVWLKTSGTWSVVVSPRLASSGGVLTGALQVSSGDITITSGSVIMGSDQVLTTQQAAVADATDAASVIARLNDLLARLRTHGIIAT